MLAAILLVIVGTYLSTTNVTAALICYLAAVWCLPLSLSMYVLAVKALASIVLVILIANERIYHPKEDSGTLTVTFIDVGQGDSTLIELPDNTVMLIDGGTSDYGQTVVKTLQIRNIKKIDYMIGTHPHADHIGGLPEVTASFNVTQYIEPLLNGIAVPDTYCVKHLSSVLNQKRIPVISASYGDVIASGGNWNVQVLSPRKDALFEDMNDYSLIIRISYGETAFLFTGDAGYSAELEILDENLRCDVLKVGHHGSFGSTCSAFLKEAEPSVAVISVGKDNENKLPNDYVVDRLREEGIRILRTDESGNITITSDGRKIEIEN